MTAAAKKLPGRPATLDDFLAIPEGERRHELIDGEIVEKAQPTGEHGATQADVVTTFNYHFGRHGGDRPGGWWFATEVETLLPTRQIVRPDVLGWRRERVPERPKGHPISILPDWVCEILSSDRRRDLIQKKRLYHLARIPHYWIVDPVEHTLFVHRWGPDGYVEVLAAERGDKARAEPFDAIEFSLGELFGEEEEEEGQRHAQDPFAMQKPSEDMTQPSPSAPPVHSIPAQAQERLDAPEEAPTHGAHWGPFMDDVLELVRQLPQILPNGLAQTGYGVGRKAPRAVPASWPEGDLWAWPLRVQGLSLVVERDRETKTLASMFPFYAAGSRHRVTLDEVTVWKNGLEAQLTVEWGEASVTFFDTQYLINRAFYEAGAEYDVILTGITYAAEPVIETELTVTPPGEPTQTWSLRGFAGLLPAGDDRRDEYGFRGPIKCVTPVHDWLGQDGWKLRTAVMRFDEEDVELDIVVTERAWKGDEAPRIGQEIEGHLWLQGYLG